MYSDLKPENILIRGDGHVMITDFGLSKQGSPEEVVAQTICGRLKKQ